MIGRTADVDVENDADGADKPDFEQAAELIKKFQGEVPGLQQLARKLEIRHEVDPELQKMLQQLEEASTSYASAATRRSKPAPDSKIADCSTGLDKAIPAANDRDEERENQSSEDQQAEEDRQAREAQQEADRKLK